MHGGGYESTGLNVVVRPGTLNPLRNNSFATSLENSTMLRNEMVIEQLPPVFIGTVRQKY